MSKGITVLSLFDGMSCGQIAFERAGIKVKTYYASEINKYAIKVTQHNYPGTIQLGDVCNVHIKDLPEIPDIIIGGSPCQGFSRAGKGLNFDDPRSKLFFEFVRLKDELLAVNPKALFFLENVEMLKEWENIISKYMGVNPVKINAALVSAQNRVRLYWSNFNLVKYGLFDCIKNEIPQPKDRKIYLKDILESEVDEKYFLSEKMLNTIKKHGAYERVNGDKSMTILSTYAKMAGRDQQYVPDNPVVHNTQPRTGDPKKGGTGHLSRNDGKTYCLDTGNTNAVEIPGLHKLGSLYENNSQGGRIYSSNGKSVAINSQSGGLGAKTGLYEVPVIYDDFNSKIRTDKKTCTLTSRTGSSTARNGQKLITGSRIRRLTPKECARLQTVPDNYFYHADGSNVISDSRIYECLGNGWCVDVIVEQFKYIKLNNLCHTY